MRKCDSQKGRKKESESEIEGNKFSWRERERERGEMCFGERGNGGRRGERER
jgi:hypothetical protein